MKFLKAVPLLGLLASAAFAAPLCVNDGSLQSYINTYTSFGNACQIGDKLFWGFTYNPSTGNEAPASLVQVQPIPFDGFSNIGIAFNSGGWVADPGFPIDAFISYFVRTVSGSVVIKDAELSITGTLSPTGATATVTETLTPVAPGSPLVASLPAPVTSHIDFLSNMQSGFFVTDEVKLSANTPGSTAHVSVVENDFSEYVPEPMMPTLVGSGLVAFAFLGRKRPRQSRTY